MLLHLMQDPSCIWESRVSACLHCSRMVCLASGTKLRSSALSHSKLTVQRCCSPDLLHLLYIPPELTKLASRELTQPRPAHCCIAFVQLLCVMIDSHLTRCCPRLPDVGLKAQVNAVLHWVSSAVVPHNRLTTHTLLPWHT